MGEYYYLDENRQPVEIDMMSWAKRFEAREQRRVAWDEVGAINVSTVFLGLNHAWEPDAVPILFETMVFGGWHDQDQERYATWDEAVVGHARHLRRVRRLRWLSPALQKTAHNVWNEVYWYFQGMAHRWRQRQQGK